MARIFSPIVPPNDPALCQPWLNRELRRISLALSGNQKGFAAIIRGEAPDGSGNPLTPPFDASNFLYLPGRAGGQTLEVLDTAPGFIIHNAALGKMQRWEGPPIAVSSCISDGTATVTHASSGFALLAIGMIVSGSLVPAGTLVTEVTNSNTIVLSNLITAGTTTMTFAHRMDLSFVANGSGTDAELLVSTGLRIRGSSQLGGQASGFRFTAQNAISTVIRAFMEVGPSNENLAITGDNGATGNTFHDLFTYTHFGTWNGSALTNATRVGINTDPYEYRSSAAVQQPDSFIVARRTGATSTVPTVIVEGTSSTEMAFAIGIDSTGTAPSKIRPNPIAGFRHDGDLVMFNSGSPAGLISGLNVHGGTSQVIQITGVSDALSYLGIGSVGSWSDGLSSTDSKFALWGGTTSSTHRAFYFASGGFGIFTRFGISSDYTLISNGQAGGSSGAFPGPDGSGSPSVLKVLNTSTAGHDASNLLKLETLRSGQTGDFIQNVDSNGNAVSGFQRAGHLYLRGISHAPQTPLPVRPAAGVVTIFADSGVNRVAPAMWRATGREQWIQPWDGHHGFALFLPGTTTTIQAQGCTGTTAGTVSHPAIASTNLMTSSRRTQFASSLAANASAGIFSVTTLCWRGNAAGLGGFSLCARFNLSTNQSVGHKAFVGLFASTTAIGTTVPSAMINMVGLAHDAADTNYQIMHNDGSGTATKVDLGSNYPADASQMLVQLELFAEPNGSDIYYRVTRLDDTSIAPSTGTLSSNLPTSTSFLGMFFHANTGTTDTDGITPQLYRMYLDTDT